MKRRFTRSGGEVWHWLFAGVVVGMAEIVPGVSGGTLALLVGVYERLLRALSCYAPGQLLAIVRTGDWRRLDLPFMLVFGLAMLAALWLLSHPLSLIYSLYPDAFRVFLCLLILASVIGLLRRLPLAPAPVVALLAGAGIGLAWTMNLQVQWEVQPLNLLLAGFGAGVLMLLPGVSGSYLLLLLGLYAAVLEAVRQFDWQLLLPLAVGALFGVVSCARLLRWLLGKGGIPVRALLYGLVLGSLWALVPERVGSPPALAVAVLGGLILGYGLYRLAGLQRLSIAAALLLPQLLWLPATLLPSVSQGQEADADTDTGSGGWLSYRIEKGENLTMIANLYDLQVADLVRWNKLSSPSRIFPGKELLIPPGTVARTYRVEEDETLSEIALRNRTFIKRLARVNGLASADLIYPGQMLRLAPELQPARHKVRRGESLWELALRYGLEFDQLAANNGIQAPYRIYPGQELSLARTTRNKAKIAKSGKASQSSQSRKTNKARKTPQTGQPKSQSRARPVEAVEPARLSNPKKWIWPASGKLEERFDPSSHKGIDIAGDTGDAVRAAASGVVRYAGNGLFRDYGWLIILGHGQYLTIYAHNDRLLVKEGEKVKAGQRIARMGATGTDHSKLHFQMKFRGRATDPLTLLPKRQQDDL